MRRISKLGASEFPKSELRQLSLVVEGSYYLGLLFGVPYFRKFPNPNPEPPAFPSSRVGNL